MASAWMATATIITNQITTKYNLHAFDKSKFVKPTGVQSLLRTFKSSKCTTSSR